MWGAALLGVCEELEQFSLIVGAVEGCVPLSEGALQANDHPLCYGHLHYLGMCICVVQLGPVKQDV